jgi:hypothetical protein
MWPISAYVRRTRIYIRSRAFKGQKERPSLAGPESSKGLEMCNLAGGRSRELDAATIGLDTFPSSSCH